MTYAEMINAIERISGKEDTTSDAKAELMEIKSAAEAMNPDMKASGHIVREFMTVCGYIG